MATLTAHVSQKFSNKSPSPSKAKDDSVGVGPTDVVVRIVEQLAGAMHTAINEIREINENAKLLSLNARIEAARAGFEWSRIWSRGTRDASAVDENCKRG